MNERIEQLALECYQAPEFDYKKFAELIVRECAKIAEKEQKFSNQYSLYNIDRCILVEFGL
jgi:hypothetical protein